MPDIDIDFADRNDLLDKLKHRVDKIRQWKETQYWCLLHRSSS